MQKHQERLRKLGYDDAPFDYTLTTLPAGASLGVRLVLALAARAAALDRRLHPMLRHRKVRYARDIARQLRLLLQLLLDREVLRLLPQPQLRHVPCACGVGLAVFAAKLPEHFSVCFKGHGCLPCWQLLLATPLKRDVTPE